MVENGLQAEEKVCRVVLIKPHIARDPFGFEYLSLRQARLHCVSERKTQLPSCWRLFLKIDLVCREYLMQLGSAVCQAFRLFTPPITTPLRSRQIQAKTHVDLLH